MPLLFGFQVPIRRCRSPNLCCSRDKIRHLQYRFHSQYLNQLNTLQELGSKIQGKNITLLGDSLQLQFFQGLREFLNISKVVEEEIKDEHRNTQDKLPLKLWKFPHNSGGWVHCLKFYQVQMDTNKRVKGKFWVSVETLRDTVKLSDVVIFNIGLHYDRTSIIDFHKTLMVVTRMLKKELTLKPSLTILFKATTPQHFQTSTGSGLYRDLNSKPTEPCAKSTANQRHPTSLLSEHCAQLHGFKFFEVHDILKNRWDLHSRDCTHYCFAREVFEPQLKLLTLLL